MNLDGSYIKFHMLVKLSNCRNEVSMKGTEVRGGLYTHLYQVGNQRYAVINHENDLRQHKRETLTNIPSPENVANWSEQYSLCCRV